MPESVVVVAGRFLLMKTSSGIVWSAVEDENPVAEGSEEGAEQRADQVDPEVGVVARGEGRPEPAGRVESGAGGRRDDHDRRAARTAEPQSGEVLLTAWVGRNGPD